MDSTETSIIAIVGLTISVFGSFLAAINHRRIRSNCCGAPLVVSVDVENTTPPLSIKVPQYQKEGNATPVADKDLV